MLRKIQWVWWGNRPTIQWWQYPIKSSIHYKAFKKPIFYGLHFGLFEVRFFVTGIVKMRRFCYCPLCNHYCWLRAVKEADETERKRIPMLKGLKQWARSVSER